MKLIDKDALVAEIEKRIEALIDKKKKLYIKAWDWSIDAEIKDYKSILSFIDSLEVKEVDLEKEIDGVWNKTSDNFLEDGWKEFENIAKHFFELGMLVSNKTQKGEEI